MRKRGQVAVFVIVALFVIGIIIVIAVLRERAKTQEIPQDLVQVFEHYQSCMEQETKNAVEIAGLQGGRIYDTEYFPGSEYAPFSSHLNFLGMPVKYWYYVSANGVIKEQVPTKDEIETEIEKYIEENLKDCNFESFYRRGYRIERAEPDVTVDILDERVNVQVNSEVIAERGPQIARKVSYNFEVDSKLGKFYNLGKNIYEKEKTEAFLEQYALDVLYQYAPVDGVEIQCAPKIWSTRNVAEELKNGLEQNFVTIKFNGNYYTLKDDKRKYFVVEQEVSEAVRILYSRSWPTKIEIDGEGVEEEIMMAEAVGTQEGMGIMGFCYVPYHFIYDIRFPALIQIYNNEEVFQFPVVVIIDNNMPRNALPEASSGEQEEFDLCEFKTQEIEVSLFNVNLEKVDGNVSFECFSQRCRLGETREGILRTVAPACTNGYLHVRAEGYADTKQLFSTNREKFGDVILEREYEVEVELVVGGAQPRGNAIVAFVRDDGKSRTAVLPEFNKVKLSEGNYEVKVYVYGNSSITIPATTKYQCVEVPRDGILGFFGAKTEKCFDITIPATKIDNALSGGGKTRAYLLDTEIAKGKVRVEVDSLPMPNSLEALAKNFESFETKTARVNFYES